MGAVWKFLHIACMFGAVSMAVGGGLFRQALVRNGDVATIRRTLAVERRLGNLLGLPLFVAGIVFGFVTALTTGFDLTAPWLVTAYVLVAAIFVNGFVVYEPPLKQLEAAAAAASDGEPSRELQRLINAPRLRVSAVVDAVLWFAIVFVMVVKPFS
jgi:uncharacterized membrane protein